MITRSKVQSLHHYPSQWSTQLMLSCFLLEELKNPQSQWKTYLQSLPSSYSVPYFDCPLPMLDFLPSIHLRNCISAQFQLIDEQFGAVKNLSNLKLFAWAWFTVNTRGVYFPDQHDNLALAPFLDMFNHSSKVSVQVQQSPDFYNLVSSSQDWQKHDQVFINYGPHDNVKLYIEYGFIVPENPHDSVKIGLQDLLILLDSKQENLEAKLKFIQDQDLHSKLQFFDDQDECISWSILACLYILKNENYKQVFHQELNVQDYHQELVLMLSRLTQNFKLASEKCQEFEAGITDILPHLLETQLKICERVLKNLTFI